MTPPPLKDALKNAPSAREGLSPVWIMILVMVVVQVLYDCFGWLEDSTIRLFVAAVAGFVAIVVTRLIRGGRI